MHRFKGKRKIEFQDFTDALFTRLHRISLHSPAFHKTKKKKLQLMFQILKAACWLTGFCFHLQVWDWLSLEEKLHFGGHTEAGVPAQRLK